MEWVVIWLLCGVVAAAIGGQKNEAGLGCLVGLLFGPLGIVIALVSSGDRVNCPFCKEKMNKKAVVCPHCQRDIPAKV